MRWRCGWVGVLMLASAVLAGGAAPAAGAAAATAAPDAPAAATVLDRYLDGLMSLRADFTQTVTDAKGAQVEAGSGSLVVQRPGKFRWDYEPHAAVGGSGGDSGGSGDAGADRRGQLLVADGENLWFYDRELEQVTVKPIDAGLSSTPIMLLSGAAPRLRANFDISAAGTHDGLDWTDVKPRSDQADFNDAQLGFKSGQLVRMVFHNALGQTVRLDFTHSQRNGRIDAAAFDFKAPPGVDVIGTPQP
ncbi:MAG: outer membrane lipoprotein carrier protein LolA [Steroidobacteraceae bacterium]